MADKHTRRKRRPPRRINLRFLWIGLAAFAVVGVGVYFLHAYQVQRSADVLLERARQLESDGKLKKAASYYRQYVGFAPDDLDARVTLANTIEKADDSLRSRFDALQTFEEVLRKDPDRHDIRRRVIEFWLSPEFARVSRTRFEDARTHIEYLLVPFPDDGKLRYQLGICREATGDYREAAESYKTAIAGGFTEPAVYVQLAGLMQERLEQPAHADELMSEMVEANPESPEALLARAVHRARLGRVDEAKRDLERAEELDPDNAQVILLLAQQVLNTVDAGEESIDRARDRLVAAQEAHPDDLRLYTVLSQLENKAGRPEEAIEALRRGQEQAPQRAEMAWLLADLLISNGRLDEAQQYIDKLRELKTTSRYVDYLRGRIHLANGDPLQAVELLKPLRGERLQNPQLARMANLQLAEAYRLMGRHEEQRDAFQKIVQAEPQSIEGRLGEAASLAALGRIDEALAIYGNYLDVPSVAAIAAQLMIASNLQRMPEERNWAQVADVLERLQATDPESAQAVLLRAEMLRAQGNSAQAQDVLEQALPSETAPALISVALARLATLRDDFAESQQILDHAQEQFGDSVPIRLARADAWERQAASGAATKIVQLAQAGEQFSDAERRTLLEGLAGALLRLQDVTAAADMWTQIAEFQPHDVSAHFRLFNLAVRRGDESTAAKSLSNLRAIEGEEGPHVRAAKAIQLVERAQPGDVAALEDAGSILRRLATQRPAWALVPLTEAKIAELAGDYDAAARNYEEAIRLGHRDPQVLLRAIQLYGSRGQQDAAVRLFRRAETETPLLVTAAVRRLVTEISLRALDFDQALSVARDSVSERSANSGDHIWLSRVLSAAGRTKESEESLRKAVELQPEEPAAWVALVLFLTRTEQTEAAEAAIEQAKQSLTEQQAPLVLGLCYEQLGQLDRAEEYYRAAVESDADDFRLSQNLIAFYLRTRRQGEAEPLLRELIDKKSSQPDADLSWERRVLAASIAKKDFVHFQEALSLLDQNIRAISEAEQDPREQARLRAADQRIKARMLASMPNKEMRRQAISILENLNQSEVLLPGDLQLLSQLYDAVDEPDKSDERWQKLIEGQTGNPAYISMHVLRLLNLRRIDQAQRWFNNLEQLAPNAFATVELGTRLSAAKKNYSKILPAITAYLESDTPGGSREDRLSQTVRLLEVLGTAVPADSEIAEALQAETAKQYRELIQQRPEVALAFARFAARSGNLDQALDLCERALETSPRSQVVATALGMVRSMDGSVGQRERVESWLEESVAQQAESVPALLQLADFRDLQQQYDEAMQLYRRVIELDPHNVVASNNLAWLLSVRTSEREEALHLINSAIEFSGPVAVLLDTRGTVLFHKGDLQQALEAFDASIEEQDLPATRFHRAQAHWAAGDHAAAKRDLESALAAGLSEDALQPLELDDYRKLLVESGLRTTD